MIDKEKVIYMTQLAIMEKNDIKKDLKITSYFEEDFVYINNLKTRIGILMVLIGVVVGDVLWKIEKGMNIPTGWEEILYNYILPYGKLVVVSLILYTILSTIVYRKIYRAADKRVKEYDHLLKKLNVYEGVDKKGEKYYANKRRTIAVETKDTTSL